MPSDAPTKHSRRLPSGLPGRTQVVHLEHDGDSLVVSSALYDADRRAPQVVPPPWALDRRNGRWELVVMVPADTNADLVDRLCSRLAQVADALEYQGADGEDRH